MTTRPLFEEILLVQDGVLKPARTEIPWTEPHPDYPRTTHVSALMNTIVQYHKARESQFFLALTPYEIYEQYHAYQQAPLIESVLGPKFSVLYRDPNIPLRVEARCEDGGPASAQIAEIMGVALYRHAQQPDHRSAISVFYKMEEYRNASGQLEREHVVLVVMGSQPPEKAKLPLFALDIDPSDYYTLLGIHLIPDPELRDAHEIPGYINFLRLDLDWGRFRKDEPTILHQNVGHDGQPGTGFMIPSSVLSIVTTPPEWVLDEKGRTVGLPTTMWQVFRACDHQASIERANSVER